MKLDYDVRLLFVNQSQHHKSIWWCIKETSLFITSSILAAYQISSYKALVTKQILQFWRVKTSDCISIEFQSENNMSSTSQLHFIIFFHFVFSQSMIDRNINKISAFFSLFPRQFPVKSVVPYHCCLLR